MSERRGPYGIDANGGRTRITTHAPGDRAWDGSPPEEAPATLGAQDALYALVTGLELLLAGPDDTCTIRKLDGRWSCEVAVGGEEVAVRGEGATLWEAVWRATRPLGRWAKTPPGAEGLPDPALVAECMADLVCAFFAPGDAFGQAFLSDKSFARLKFAIEYRYRAWEAHRDRDEGPQGEER